MTTTALMKAATYNGPAIALPYHQMNDQKIYDVFDPPPSPGLWLDLAA
jgi:hypothetical protein